MKKEALIDTRLAETCLAAALLFCGSASAESTLTPNIRIDSEALGYALQYRVYRPDAVDADDDLPTIYMTDGQWYLKNGDMVEILDREIAAGRIEPVVAVFLDSRDPDRLSRNRRNQQFMCSEKFVSFFVNELVPEISNNFPVSGDRDDRVIAGVSFGALNAACFGLMASHTFGGVGMHSPASSRHLRVIDKQYRSQERQPVAMFFSVGTRRDNTKAARRFYRTLEEKGYEVSYVEVPYGHTWSNWQPLIDDLLATFFATGP